MYEFSSYFGFFQGHQFISISLMQWCIHLEGQSTTELQLSNIASTGLNLSQVGKFSTYLNLRCWAGLIEGWGQGWGHPIGLVGLKWQYWY